MKENITNENSEHFICWVTAPAKFPPALSPEIPTVPGSALLLSRTLGCKTHFNALYTAPNWTGKLFYGG